MLNKYEDSITSLQPGPNNNKGHPPRPASLYLLTSLTIVFSPFLKHLFPLLGWLASLALLSGPTIKYPVPFLGFLSSLASMSGQVVDISSLFAEKSKSAFFLLYVLALGLPSVFATLSNPVVKSPLPLAAQTTNILISSSGLAWVVPLPGSWSNRPICLGIWSGCYSPSPTY